MKNKSLLFFVLIALTSQFLSADSKDFTNPFHFPYQDSTQANNYKFQSLIVNEELWIFFIKPSYYEDSLFFSRTTDNGETWQEPEFIVHFDKPLEETTSFSVVKTSSGRIIIVYMIDVLTPGYAAKFLYSDNLGDTWSPPQNVIGTAAIPNPKLVETNDNKLWILGRNTHLFYSGDNGLSWAAKNIGFSVPIGTRFNMNGIIDSTYLLFYTLNDESSNEYNIYSRKTTNAGSSWSEPSLLSIENISQPGINLFRDSDNHLNLVLNIKEETGFQNIFQVDIEIVKSTDNGITWNPPIKFTHYSGFDGEPSVSSINGKTFISFLSDRWYGRNQIWLGEIGVTQDNDTPPVLFHFENSELNVNQPILIRAYAGSPNGILKAELFYKNDTLVGPVYMYDDGLHNDESANDNIWGISIGPFTYYSNIHYYFRITDSINVDVNFEGTNLIFPPLPVENKWLSAGSLHNWYSSIGSEIEHGFEPFQQFGLRWPAIYDLQDNQCSKGLWIGAKNFTDENGRFFSNKVIHVGPRVNGEYVFYPKEFKLIGKFANPLVVVNGIDENLHSDIDLIDPSIPSDRMLKNTINTQLGITIERNIYQFGQEFHNNYIISEYTFTNTGNTDFDNTIELQDNVLTDVYFYYLYRWAITRNTRYAIGNGTGWGMNIMLDSRGDGVMPDPPEENFRAQYAWHGNFPPFIEYDNIGAPLWNPALGVAPGDTIGRLGAPQFVGVVTLHADKSSTDKSDDLIQPSTTSWEGSDEPETLMNDPLNDQKMAAEYIWLSRGHKSPRHAYAVKPSGNFTEPTGDPALGTPGGFSAANGYGPYTLGPGDSIKIVWAEAVDGIDRETAIEVGGQFKWGQITAKEKNEVVLSGQDSLFKTFRKAIENYDNGNGFKISQAPYPPGKFEVNAGEDKVYLKWHHNGQGPTVKGFEIYRASGGYDSVHTLIQSASSADTSFTDSTIIRGKNYYYYIQAVGDPLENSGDGMTPPGALKSSRYYTQTYQPVTSTLTDVVIKDYPVSEYKLYQNYPNPFNPITTITYNVKEQGLVSLRVYNLLGEEVAILVNEEKNSGSYKINFNAFGLSSGIYFYKLQVNNFIDTKKFILLK
jgi:hypothetical protein